jgi:hypothetical protein
MDLSRVAHNIHIINVIFERKMETSSPLQEIEVNCCISDLVTSCSKCYCVRKCCLINH